MALSAEQLEARKGKLTASRVGVLMNGDDAALHDLWRECTGDPSYEPPDLSGVWPVQLGSHTEVLNLRWYTRKVGRAVTRQGEVVVSQERDWAAATLDGWDAAYPLAKPGEAGLGEAGQGTAGPGEAGQGMEPAVIEAKHVGGFEPRETVVARYMPQVHWQMYCTDSRLAVLSIIEGAREPVLEEIPRDDEYVAELLRRADEFWRCVETLTPPVALPPADPPRPVAARVVDMGQSNSWANFAADWLENRGAAKTFNAAVKELKTLVEPDVKRAFAHGIQATRARNGAITIKEMTNV